MAAPHLRLRKQLSAPGLLQTIRQIFEAVPEHRHDRNEVPLADALMSGLAVFGLKYPSLLKFDEAYHAGVILHNLQTLYGVERAPCDTQLRTLALLRNFCPSSPATVKQHHGQRCPAERPNGKRYAEHWLENLLVSGSINGLRHHQQNTLYRAESYFQDMLSIHSDKLDCGIPTADDFDNNFQFDKERFCLIRRLDDLNDLVGLCFTNNLLFPTWPVHRELNSLIFS
jgi:hypothetical protein